MGDAFPYKNRQWLWVPARASLGRDDTECAPPHPKFNSLKKSLPLSSMMMKAGNSSTSMRQIASMPSSGYSTTSTFLMQCSARFAAAPPIEKVEVVEYPELGMEAIWQIGRAHV